MGHTANYCIVIAQLYTNGKHCGIQSFIVQLRDEETHMPLPGIKLGEIGAKLGYNLTNNGFLGFDNFRIPRDRMLMKNAQVLKVSVNHVECIVNNEKQITQYVWQDGTFVASTNSKLVYGTMVFIRVALVIDSANFLAKAAVIAVRYSVVRRQSQIKAK